MQWLGFLWFGHLEWKSYQGVYRYISGGLYLKISTVQWKTVQMLLLIPNGRSNEKCYILPYIVYRTLQKAWMCSRTELYFWSLIKPGSVLQCGTIKFIENYRPSNLNLAGENKIFESMSACCSVTVWYSVCISYNFVVMHLVIVVPLSLFMIQIFWHSGLCSMLVFRSQLLSQ